MKYYLTIKRKEILPFVITRMSLEDIMLSKISQTEKKKNTVDCSLICEIFKKKKKSELTDTKDSLLQGQANGECEVKLLSCVRLCDPMDCSPPGSSVRRIFQARILEWVAMSFSRGSSHPRE